MYRYKSIGTATQWQPQNCYWLKSNNDYLQDTGCEIVIALTQWHSVGRCPDSGRCRYERNTSWPTEQQVQTTEQTCALADHCLTARQSPEHRIQQQHL